MSTQETKLKAIADAIREKDGTTEPISANDFPSRIRAIPSEQAGLPAGYTKLEYIESSGTQYINTWFYPTPKTRVVADITLPEYSAAMYLFGMRSEGSTTAAEQFMVGYLAANRLRYSYYGTFKNLLNVQGLTDRAVINADKNVLSVGDTSVTMDETALEGPASYPLFLFAYNNVGRVAGYTSGKLYSCQIYDNDILQMDLVPCINPRGVVGLYDVEGKTFFGSFGTGEFIAGSAV